MVKTISQKIAFKNTKPEILYNMFLNGRHHSAITGGAAKISSKEGVIFSVYDGYAAGRNLQLIKDKLIVQSWFASDWAKGEPDSTFILLFEQKGKDTIISMTHANVPDEHVAGIKKGWADFYWKPWKKYLISLT
jgi:activator of HSP90 ATPase